MQLVEAVGHKRFSIGLGTLAAFLGVTSIAATCFSSGHGQEGKIRSRNGSFGVRRRSPFHLPASFPAFEHVRGSALVRLRTKPNPDHCHLPILGISGQPCLDIGIGLWTFLLEVEITSLSAVGQLVDEDIGILWFEPRQ